MTKSLYDDRETVGTIAQKAVHVNERVEVGDMSREIMKSFVEDLNDMILAKPYGDRSFYITVHEKKDLQMKNVIMRRMVHSQARPFPEENTSVFWTDPKSNITKFCWSIPHRSVFPNVLENEKKYGKEQIMDIKNFEIHRMEHFGFIWAGETETGVPIWIENITFKDRDLRK